MHFSIKPQNIRFPEGSTLTPNETTPQHITAEVSLETPAGSKTDRAKLLVFRKKGPPAQNMLNPQK